jgi:chromosome segregation ATPase
LSEIKKLQNSVTGMRKEIATDKIRMEDVDSAIDKKMDYSVSSIKKEAAFNAASLARLDEEVRKFTLDVNSLKKDFGSSGAMVGKLSSSMERLQKKVAGLEKLQVKLGKIGDAKQALTEAMEAKLEERIKFLEMTLRQKAENIEASLSEKSVAAEKRIDNDLSSIKKDLVGKSKAIGSVESKLDKIVKIEERLRANDKDKAAIAKNVSSLQDMKSGLSKVDERSRSLDSELRALKAQTESGMAEVRGNIDSKKTEEGNKFSTAVKAFLNARADLNKKISLLELRLTDSNKRVSDFSNVVSRIDLLERKVDRLTEKGSQIRRDMDGLERKGEPDEKVMVVDLGKNE